jgi:hypothetical protein
MTRNLLLLVHLAAVAAWLGANFVQFVVAPRLRRAGPPTARHWVETTRFLGQRYYNVAGILVGVSGVLLVLHGHWRWQGFVFVGIAMVLIGATLGIAVFEPLLRKEAAAIDAGDEQEVARLRHSFMSIASLDTFLLLITMLAMIDKWKGAVS